MRFHASALLLGFALACTAAPAIAQVRRLTELNTDQIRALDRSRTVVLLTGGMLEEHGPYLPAFTDGILSDRLTQELAQAVVAGKPGWTALLFPQIPFGASGSNELGGHFVFPGTYQGWIKAAAEHDADLDARQREWLRKKTAGPPRR